MAKKTDLDLACEPKDSPASDGPINRAATGDSGTGTEAPDAGPAAVKGATYETAMRLLVDLGLGHLSPLDAKVDIVRLHLADERKRGGKQERRRVLALVDERLEGRWANHNSPRSVLRGLRRGIENP